MASYEKRGKSIRAVVSVMDRGVRKKVSKTFRGKRPKKEAEDWALHMEVDKADNRQILTSNMLFSDYFEKWYTRYKINDVRKSTLATYVVCQSVISTLYPYVKLSQLTYPLLQERLDDYAKTHKKSYVQVIMHKIKASLKDALLDGYISKDIFSRLKAHGLLGKKNNVLSATEFEKLNNFLYAHWQDSPYYLPILVALETGMRIGEVLMISKEEVFPDFNMIYVKHSYSSIDPNDIRTKNSQSVRKIKITPQLSKVLKTALRSANGRLFTVTVKTLERNQEKLMDKLGINRITFHGLRHSHVSYLLYKGLSLEYVAKRVGHIDTTTTQKVYAHLLKEQELKEDSKAVDVLSSVSPNVPKASKKA